jgi:hypothetical protein
MEAIDRKDTREFLAGDTVGLNSSLVVSVR